MSSQEEVEEKRCKERSFLRFLFSFAFALFLTLFLPEHNAGENRFTKGHRPWKVIYTETHPGWTTARKSRGPRSGTGSLRKPLVEVSWIMK